MAQLLLGLGVTGLGVRDIVDDEVDGFFVAAVGVFFVAVIGEQLARLRRSSVEQGTSERSAFVGAVIFVVIGLVVIADGLIAADLTDAVTVVGLVAGTYCVVFGASSWLAIRRVRHHRRESPNALPRDPG